MLDHREDIEYVLLEEGGAIFVLEVVLAQQYLYASLNAKAAQQRDLLQVEVLDGGVHGFGCRCLPVVVALQIALDLLPERFWRQRGPLHLRLLWPVVPTLALVATLGSLALQLDKKKMEFVNFDVVQMISRLNFYLFQVLLWMNQLSRRQKTIEEVADRRRQAH